MRRLLVRSLLALALVAVLVGAGLALTTLLSPERLRVMAEQQLAEWTGHPVSVGQVEIALGVGIQLRGEDLELWPQPDGPGLRVERIGVGLEPLSLLAGNLRPRRIVLEGAELRIAQQSDGDFSPPFERRDPPEEPASPEPLAPLVVTEGFFRFLLDRPYLADATRVERSRVLLTLRGEAPGAKPRVFSLAIAEGRLVHRRLRGDAVLDLAGGLFDRSGSLGSVSIHSRRDTAGALELDLELGKVALAALQKYVPGLEPGAGLGGRARGTLALRSPEPGSARLDVALAFDEPEARVLEETPWGPLRAPRLEVEGRVEVTPEQLGIEALRLEGGDLRLELDGAVGRPFAAEAPAKLEFTFRELDVEKLHALLDWLPYEPARQLGGLLASVRSGRLPHFTARGAGRLGEWRDFFARGRNGEALGLEAEAEIADLVVAVGEEDRLEIAEGSAGWGGDRLRTSGLRGTLNGEPLPLLDLGFEGVSHVLAADPERRKLRAGALPLPGVGTLWEILSGPDEGERDPRAPLAVDLEVDWLHHPVCLWPLESLRASVRSRPDGLRVELDEGTWGGTLIRGNADWRFEPEQQLRVSIRASAPQPGVARRPPGRRWARGSFLVGPLVNRHWQQRGAEGKFEATAGVVRVQGLTVDLEPQGRLEGSGSLDLSGPDGLPLQLSLALAGGDVDGLLRWAAPDREIATGSVDAWGSFDGRLRPGQSPFADLVGLVEVEAVDGRIRRALPPIVAIALASRSFNPFVEREFIRYQSARATAEIEEGRVSSRELAVEGPDLRVMASGSVDLVDEEHAIDAEVALFLFRPIDKAVGTIPLLNVLLLGTDQNLMAAYFKLRGPWNEPNPELVPLKSLAAGPGSLVLEGVPGVVRRGVRALGAVLKGGEEPEEPAKRPEPAPWRETPRDS